MERGRDRLPGLLGVEIDAIETGHVRMHLPLRPELLAPNGRPQQVTEDLASFWKTAYPEIRKELRGRYPKHAWPDDPLTARAESKGHRRGP